MGLISNYFGEKKYLNLAEKKEEAKRASRPKSTNDNSSSSMDTKKTIRTLLESDWFTFATINTVSALFSRPKTKLITENETVWNKFFENMKLYGDSSSIKRLRSELKRDAVAYGSGYVELIPAQDSTEIVDIKRIDASRIEHAKDAKGHLILNELGNSIGFVLHLGPNADTRGRGDPIPFPFEGSINLQQGDVFLLPARVRELPLYKKANGVEPIGLVEPAITQTQRRQKLEDAQVNAIWIRGTAPLFALVGDSQHEPNPQMMEDALDSLVEMRNSNVMAFPYYQEPKALDAKIDDISTKIMNNLMFASAGAASTPLPFITGAGEATNRSTLKTQREIFEENIQEKINNFDEDFNLKILDTIAAVNKYPRAKIISSDVRLESKDELSKRLKTYFDMQALAPKEIRKIVLDLENIEPDDKAYDEFIKKPEPQKIISPIEKQGIQQPNNIELNNTTKK